MCGDKSHQHDTSTGSGNLASGKKAARGRPTLSSGEVVHSAILSREIWVGRQNGRANPYLTRKKQRLPFSIKHFEGDAEPLPASTTGGGLAGERYLAAAENLEGIQTKVESPDEEQVI